MDPELQKQAADIFRQAVAGGASEEQASRVARMYLDRQGGSSGPSKLESFGRGLAQGATLGFADEIAAGVRAIGDGNYRDELEKSRSRDEAAREAHGGYMLAGDVAGSVATGLVGGAAGTAARGTRALAGASRGARAANAAGRLATTAGGIGAIEGAARSEGTGTERLDDAAVGGVVGAATGGLLNFGGNVGRRLLEGAGVSSGVQRRGQNKILDALEADDLSVGDLQGRMTGAPDEMLLDLSPKLTELAESADQFGGSGSSVIRESLDNRHARQLDEVRGGLESATGIDRQSSSAASEQIRQARQQAADELFPRAYAQGPVAVTPELAGILSKPSAGRAYQEAQQIAAERGIPLAPLESPDAQTLHLIKLGLDDVVAKGKMPGTGGQGPVLRYEYDQTRRALLGEIRRVAPDLSQALDTYAGDSAMRDALELGFDRFTKDPPESIARQMSEMTTGEAEMFRQGGVDALIGKLEGTADRLDLLKRFMQSPRERDRIRLLFDQGEEGDMAFAAFADQIDALRGQAVNRQNVVGNSRTSRRERMKQDLEGRGIGDLLSPTRIANSFFEDRRGTLGSETADALGPLLTASGDDLSGEILPLLSRRASRRGQADLAGRAAVLGGAGASAQIAPSLLSLLYDEERAP